MEDEELIFLGRHHGERTVTVETVGAIGVLVEGIFFNGVTALRMGAGQSPFKRGESGGPILRYDAQRNGYRMSCIFFALPNSEDDTSTLGFAIPASVIERELKIKFGNSPPVVAAGRDRLITAGNGVTLLGAVGDPDPGDQDHVLRHHTWTQHDDNPATVTLTPVTDKPFQRTFTPTLTGEYNFTLTATDQEDWSVSDEVCVGVLASSQSIIPTNVTATAAARSVDISWDELSIATGYELQLGVREDGDEIGYASYTTDALTYKVENLAPQTRYYYRMRVIFNNCIGPWTAAASVVTPGETPPVPTAAQWSVRYRNNRIQVKMKELPATTPAIDQVKAKLGISPLGTGLGSDTITVTRDIGTRLNRWVNVLTDADANWQVGAWTAQVRFENTVGESAYSAGKPVVVTPPNNPPVAFAGYHQVARTNRRVNLTNASASDPDAADQEGLTYSWIRRSGPFVLLNNANSLSPWFMAPRTAGTLKFRLRVTDPQGARDTDDVTIRVFAGATSSWYDTREEDGCGPTKRKRQTRLFKGKIEKQWVSTPEEVIWTDWADTDETRNQDIGDWTNTGRTRENPVTIIVENEQTRTITWEKEQRRTNQCDQSETQWVPASRTETRWVPYSSLETTEWEDVDPAVYEGCGPNRRKQQTRIYLGNREYQYVADPEELVCSGPWTDVVPAETLESG